MRFHFSPVYTCFVFSHPQSEVQYFYKTRPSQRDQCFVTTLRSKFKTPLHTLKAGSHSACRAHAVPTTCRAAKGLECVFPISFTQCGRVWFTLAMPRPCHTLTMPFFSRPQHSTAVERRPVDYLPAFGFFRLPRGVPRRLLSEAYLSPSQRSIPTTVKSGSSTLQKDDLLNCWTSSSDISGYHADFHEGHGTVGARQGRGMAYAN
jgi:hypothetical protein